MLWRSVDRGDKSDVNTGAKPPLIVIIKRALCVLDKIHDGGLIYVFGIQDIWEKINGIRDI